MNDLLTNEITYCTRCGSANKKSAVICSECEEKMVYKYRPFYDFLKKHTKDEISDVATDTFFSLLKKYLISHIYGMALSVTIVAATVSTVYSVEPHVEKLKTEEPPLIALQTAETTENEGTEEIEAQEETPEAIIEEEVMEETEEETPQTVTFDDDTLYDFEHLACNYDGFVDEKRSSEPYWDTSVSYYNSASEMYAEKNIPGYNYSSVHEMITNPIDMHSLELSGKFDDMEEVNYDSDRGIDSRSAKSGENCTTALAKKLYADGYTVAECNYVLCETASDDMDDYMRKLVYRFVFVKYNGEWYIAEDRLISRMDI